MKVACSPVRCSTAYSSNKREGLEGKGHGGTSVTQPQAVDAWGAGHVTHACQKV